MKPELIRADGTRQSIDNTQDIGAIEKLIGAKSLDHVNLRNGFLMWVDDLGHQNGLPVNAEATRLYHSICRPGTTHQIVGDVVLTRAW